jgi:glutathione-regulated potassium-efflux system ancillary protein KefC
MVLAGCVGKDYARVRRLRTLTSADAFLLHQRRLLRLPTGPDCGARRLYPLSLVNLVTKIVGVYPVTKHFGWRHNEAMYTTLLMSTGLTFGTTSALFGLSHDIINQGQYSALVAAVIASAMIPTVIAMPTIFRSTSCPKPGPRESWSNRRDNPTTADF